MPLRSNGCAVAIPFSKGYWYAKPQIIFKRVI